MESDISEMTVEEQILQVLEEMREDNAAYYAASSEDVTGEMTTDAYYENIIAACDAGMTISLCALGVQLVLLGTVWARIFFRKM